MAEKRSTERANIQKPAISEGELLPHDEKR